MISKLSVVRINYVCGYILRTNNKGGYGLDHCYQDTRSIFKWGSVIGTESHPL